MVVDYIIVGQGICGTFLSWNLIKQGKSVMVIDDALAHSSSKVASGIINPVTGRRIVKTWMIDELLPFANEQYKLLGAELGADLVQQCNVLQFHSTIQMRDAFEERYANDTQYLKTIDDAPWKKYFNFIYGVGEIDPCLLVNLNVLLAKWRSQLLNKNALLQAKFNVDDLVYTPDAVNYKNIKAKKIIFCSGVNTFDLPFFKLLPFAKNKGEAIIVEIEDLPRDNIYKQAFSIVPWQDDLFWIGSTYLWNYTDALPTAIFRQKVEEQLNFWLRIPYKIVDHLAAERPATIERRPFVGLHPLHSSIGIFNGMGTKGCSLAPYFAKQFADHLVHNSPLAPDVDIQRFKRILSQV